MTSTLIQTVRLIDPLSRTDKVTDVLITDGVVQSLAPDAISDQARSNLTVVDGQGAVLAPGLVDLYSESSEPGHESRETLHSLRAAARAGGFTRLGILPTTDPVIDNPAQVARIGQSSQVGAPRLLPWGALTQAAQGKKLNELMELAASNIVGLTDSRPLENLTLLRRILEYLQTVQKPIALWPCDRTLTGTGMVREGAAAIRLGFEGIPITAETIPLAAILEQVADILAPVHLMRISTARSVDLIRDAKSRGLPVTASVSWMHLLFNTENLDSYDPNLRLAPPLGNPKDQQALIAGLEDGTLDAIAIDHRAYTYEEKTVAFGNAPPGAIGLELALPILWQQFVASAQWSALQLWQYLSLNPCHCLGIAPPTVQAEHPAELVLFKPDLEWTVSPEALKSLSSNTPWLGQPIQGRVEQVWIP